MDQKSTRGPPGRLGAPERPVEKPRLGRSPTLALNSTRSVALALVTTTCRGEYFHRGFLAKRSPAKLGRRRGRFGPKKLFGTTRGRGGLPPPRLASEAKMSSTDEKVERLRQLWLDGRSASQISAALGHGLTRNAVIGKVHRFGPAGRAKASAPASRDPGRLAPRLRGAWRSRRFRRRRPSGHVVHGNTVMAHARYGRRGPAFTGERGRRRADVAARDDRRVEQGDVPMAARRSYERRISILWLPAPGAAPYCTYHGKLAYQPVQDRRRERDRDRRMLIAR